ncbi:MULTISPECIES: hypothetical protein [Exiguobacterium]|uniref:hypothetical protein n=2 Tax=Bacillales Family XII. Incertae Sedis TaxID=539742 RepID=UPI000877688C|nr:hypothetical protein EVJ32_13065 [Exiguobacterium sp. SH5S4]TCI56278.1 hypothetical protein EVJ24_03605 [Exiguobacterium sp. SH1S21]TCI57151.1 hypothetical protein EVJ30_02560 [Exiguobacterium sp. SH5S13]TCI65067.1 hypothetical protein EVJ21_00270 [Exiguobacterium sp. SH0S2]TCI80518.1 hypothetical protein EVJ20_04180 [Exiguobacterium sp. SH0S1]
MMPWNMKDYPESLKNFDPLVKKKAIDIANALIAQGYSDQKAIPIATEQAKKWHEHATNEERQDFKDAPDPQKSDRHGS